MVAKVNDVIRTKLITAVVNVTNELVENFLIVYVFLSGPETWCKRFPSSNGKAQSPINIETKASTCVAFDEPLVWRNYEKKPECLMIRNTGHTVQITGQWTRGSEPVLWGGVLGKKLYAFQKVDFRWGPNNKEGSEHTIDGQRYSLEMQLIHTCVTNPDELLCVSYMFKLSQSDNLYLNNVFNNFWEIVSPGLAAWINPFPLHYIANSFKHNYYSYVGSLTYPPCTENVTWIVYPEILQISQRQINKFRKLYGKDGQIVTNSRPIQQYNDRPVYFFNNC